MPYCLVLPLFDCYFSLIRVSEVFGFIGFQEVQGIPVAGSEGGFQLGGWGRDWFIPAISECCLPEYISSFTWVMSYLIF